MGLRLPVIIQPVPQRPAVELEHMAVRVAEVDRPAVPFIPFPAGQHFGSDRLQAPDRIVQLDGLHRKGEMRIGQPDFLPGDFLLLIQSDPQPAKVEIRQAAPPHQELRSECLAVKRDGPVQVGHGKADVVDAFQLHDNSLHPLHDVNARFPEKIVPGQPIFAESFPVRGDRPVMGNDYGPPSALLAYRRMSIAEKLQRLGPECLAVHRIEPSVPQFLGIALQTAEFGKLGLDRRPRINPVASDLAGGRIFRHRKHSWADAGRHQQPNIRPAAGEQPCGLQRPDRRTGDNDILRTDRDKIADSGDLFHALGGQGRMLDIQTFRYIRIVDSLAMPDKQHFHRLRHRHSPSLSFRSRPSHEHRPGPFESVFLVQGVRVFRRQASVQLAEPVGGRDQLDQPSAESMAAMSGIDINVAQPVHRRVIRHYAGKSDLSAFPVNAVTEGILNRLRDRGPVSPVGPIALA
ncbi:hypothetical protein BN871_FY_00230 [Paenibacillus sp. P22]|nr:hypothetical protein BN871_FY_00230 [Paenibacillus sp. P22]